MFKVIDTHTHLDAVNVPAERKEELAKYAQKMMKRQY